MLTRCMLVCSLAFWLLPGGRIAHANAAAPGFWDAGHGTTMTPLFTAEAKAISMIQMRKELVLVDLYADHAVVKGTYWFFNHDNTDHRIHVGYPVNGSNRAYPMEHVHFNDLHHLRVFVDGKSQPHFRLSDHPDPAILNRKADLPTTLGDAANWYVWRMDFPARETVRVDVYFIVLTPATLTQGYAKKKANAFEYVLQTGSAWKDSILNGDIVVTLKSGMTTRQIMGIYPDSSTIHAGEQLLYSFRDLRPGAGNDLIIWYMGERDPVLSDLDPEDLYRAIDKTDVSILGRKDLQVLDRSDFSTPASAVTYLFILSLILGTALSILLFYGLYRLIRFLVRRTGN